jgi:hypothetical protein
MPRKRSATADEQQYTIESLLLLDCIEFIEAHASLDTRSQRVLSYLRAIAQTQDQVHSPRWVVEQFGKLLEQAHDRRLLSSAGYAYKYLPSPQRYALLSHILADPGLSHNAKLLSVFYLTEVAADEDQWFARVCDVDLVSAGLGLSESDVRKAYSELLERGWLVRQTDGCTLFRDDLGRHPAGTTVH